MSNEELRSKYVKVSSQEEANKVYDYLESIGEIVDRNWNKYNNAYCYIVHTCTKWILSVSNNSRYSEITLSEFLNEKYDTLNVLDIEVGDTVRCISENKSKFGIYAGFGWEANLEFVVDAIDRQDGYNIYFYNGQGVFSDAVRLVKRKKGLIEEKGTLYYKVALVDEAAGISCCKKGDIFSSETTDKFNWTALKDNFPGWVCNIDFSDIFNTLQEAEEFAKTLIEPIKKEIDEKKSMTSEELLEEARKKYPIDTKCICLTDNTIETITSDLEWTFNRITQINAPETRVYYKGKWAEIIETPIKVEHFNSSKEFSLIKDSDFEIGDMVEIIDGSYGYSTYNRAFEAIGFINKTYNSATKSEKLKGTIFHICKHPDYPSSILFSINLENDKQILIGKSGIKKVKPKGLSDVLERDFDSITKTNIVDRFTESLKEDRDDGYYKVDTSMY